jgi:hypothetical protein
MWARGLSSERENFPFSFLIREFNLKVQPMQNRERSGVPARATRVGWWQRSVAGIPWLAFFI